MLQTILLVEDDFYLREALAELLEMAGYEVITAADGLEALDRLARTRPDVILLDLMMPRMNGWEFCAAIEGMDADWKQIPLIVASASGARARELPERTRSYLPKAFTISQLLEVIGQVEQSPT